MNITNMLKAVCFGLFVISATVQAQQSKPKGSDGIEWPPESQRLTDGPRAGYFPHTDKYVTFLGAPQMLKKGMYVFSIPLIWYEQGDDTVLMSEGFLLKFGKNQFVDGMVCDAWTIGSDMSEGNHWQVCETKLIATDLYYFRQDDPLLTGAKVKAVKIEPMTAEEKALLG